jgi:transposase
MLYVGLDVHLKQSTFCVLDSNGNQRTIRTVRGHWSVVVSVLASLEEPFAICFEASCGFGPLHDQLREIARRVVVAHPGQVRLIFRSKRKNDRIDAQKLAKLLFLGEVPPVHVPSVDVRAWRAMIEHREGVVARVVRTKNKLRALLRGLGIDVPHRGHRLWTKYGLKWVASLELQTPLDRLRRDQLLAELATDREAVRLVTRELDKIAGDHLGVKRLTTIPGIGPRTAEAFVAYLDDVTRFSHAKQVGSYLGLVPSQDSSGSVNRLGHITRQGPPTARKLLVEAAWQSIHRSPTVAAYYQRIRRDDPERNKIALVATAHYLARVMFALLRKQQDWKEAA